jgi:class 3 adenylate cyclase
MSRSPEGDDPLAKSRDYFRSRRFDVVTEVLKANPETGEVELLMRPDPRRYEWRERKGERWLYDRFDDVYIADAAWKDLIRQAQQVPISYERQEIAQADTYIASRLEAIDRMVRGEAPNPPLEDKSEEFLNQLKEEELGFVILSLDVVRSTETLQRIGEREYGRIIGAILYEASEVLPIFHGFVLSYVGDGLIAYFPEPSFMRKNDLAFDCALTIRGLVYKAIHPTLERHGLPLVDVRMGIEAGRAPIVTTGSPAAKSQRDIRGQVVNMAKKIEGTAEPGGINLGESTVYNLHTGWRQLLEPVDPPADWPYKNADGELYRIYRIRVARAGEAAS